MPRPSKIIAIPLTEIGERVRALRDQKGITQVKLAKVLGTSQAALSQIELGRRGLTVQQVVKLARVLGATPNDILGNGKRERTRERPRDTRLLRRFYRIERMTEAQRQTAIKMLDSFIEAHSLQSNKPRRRTSA